jgi:hypothetical protein
LVLRYAHIARRSRFVVNEISRNKVAVPEGVVGLIRSFLLVEFSFKLNYCVVRFDLAHYKAHWLVILDKIMNLIKNFVVIKRMQRF